MPLGVVKLGTLNFRKLLWSTPCHPARAQSCLISEAKQGRAWLVLGWEETVTKLHFPGIVSTEIVSLLGVA